MGGCTTRDHPKYSTDDGKEKEIKNIRELEEKINKLLKYQKDTERFIEYIDDWSSETVELSDVAARITITFIDSELDLSGRYSCEESMEDVHAKQNIKRSLLSIKATAEMAKELIKKRRDLEKEKLCPCRTV
jgi:RNA processing factor Prp31